MMISSKTSTYVLLAVAGSSLAACQSALRPEQSSINSTFQEALAKPPVVTPIVIPEQAQSAPGSLWQPGNRQFFKDSRAHKVGDIVTVVVSEAAKAEAEATTESSRSHDSDTNIGNVGNLEGLLSSRHIINAAGNLLNTDSNRKFSGEGKTEREDTLTATVAAVVTQVLPNGYMVIQGKREVVVNYELQEMQIQGIVRPEDISANNTITSDKIAEARIFYAGRGIVDETQTPQYGVRFFDKVAPF